MKKLLALLLLVTFYSAYAQTGEQIGYYYHGRKMMFPVSNARLVIQFRQGEKPDNRRAQLASLLQVPGSSITSLAGDKQAVAKLPASFGSLKIKSLITQLAKQGYVDFVHRCITSAYGKEMGYGDELVVKLKKTTSDAMFANFLQQRQCSVVRKYASSPNIYIVSAGAANGHDAMAVSNVFFESGLFVYAQPDFTLFDGLFTDPNDPLFGYQWGHTNTGSAIQYNGVAGTDMKVQQAWGITTGAGITIAILDEGVDTGHADLKANLLQGFNCLTGTANPGDGRPLGPARGHGTCCAGIMAAVASNATGIAGVAPDSKIIPINLAAANGSFTAESNIAAGFDYAWQHGADVISNSWGGGTPSDVLDDAILRAVTMGRGGKGSIVLFASGNNNAGLSYPATNNNVISVGGVNMCGRRKSPASFTCDGEGWGACYGTGLDVVAPCVKIATTDISGTGGYNTAAGSAGDYFLRFNGTSSATPNTAGVVALILAANNSLTVSQLRNILESTCYKLPSYSYSMVSGQPNGTWNNETGHGLVDAFSAVQAAVAGNFCNVQIQANGATRFCAGGSVGLTVINPVAGTSYQWRKDGVSLGTGTAVVAGTGGSYDVVATAINGCIAVAAPLVVTALTNTPALSANAGIDTFICAGQPVQLGGYAPALNGAPWLPEKRVFGMDWQSNNFVKFSLTNPLQFDTIAKNVVSNADYAAEDFFTGGDFTPYGYYAITPQSNKLVQFDTATGAQHLIGIAAAPSGYLWSGLAWDASTRTLYALASASSGSRLCIIHPLTAVVLQTIPVAVPSAEWVAISNSGQVYVMSDNNYVYTINKQTGAAVALPNPVGADVVYQQDADFDPLTDSLYLTALIQYQTFASDLRRLNTTTGVSSVIGSLGGLSEVDATGIAGPGYQYNWLPAAGLSSTNVSQPVATPLATTTYTLQVTDMCGNTASNQVTIKVSTPPAATITASADSICVGETARLSTATGSGYTYQWYLNSVPVTGASDSIYMAANGGVYTVRIINGACDSLSQPVTIKTCELRLNNNLPETLCSTYFYDSGGAASGYSAGESFTKTITASTPGALPQLTFSAFSTEPGNDSLTIYDGSSTTAPVLAVLSGTPQLPLTFTGVSGALTIRFVSNGTVNDAGWAATIGCYQPTVYRSRTSGNADSSSSWQLKSGSSFINATTIPHQYDDSIIVQPGHTITISNPAQLDQLLVQTGAVLTIAAPLTLNDGAGTDLQSDGSLVINASGSISGNGSLVANGNLDNSASVNCNVLVQTTLSGKQPQIINAGGAFSGVYISNPQVAINLANSMAIDSLVMNNGAGVVAINGINGPSLLSINYKLDLQNGRLIAGGNAVLNIAGSAVINGGSDHSFVEGPVRNNTSAAGLSTLFFPIGATVYRPVVLNITHSVAGAAVYQAQVFNGAPTDRLLAPTINAVNNNRYFRILNMSSAPISNSTVTLVYGTDDLVTDPASLRMARDNGAGMWVDAGGAGTATETGAITAIINPVGWGDFVLANALGGSNAFAMRWLQADAVLVGKQVQVTWKIGNEVNISQYILERSADGITFTTIATVNAQAGNAAEKQYDAADLLPEKGINYYRVRQTAKGGRTTYSRQMQVNVAEAIDFIAWPNPATTVLHFQNRQIMTRLQCFNSNGQLVLDVKPGNSLYTIAVRHWAAGVYTIRMTSGGQTTQTRFVKQ